MDHKVWKIFGLAQSKLLLKPCEPYISMMDFSTIHCKYIQCIFYTFYMCPTFHCNLTVLFTFNCCSKFSGINVKLIYSFLTVTSMENTCKVYTFYMCPVSTVISLYIFAVY